jgi:hypothetical protein
MPFLFESFKLGEAFQLRLGGNIIQSLQRGDSSILLLTKDDFGLWHRIPPFILLPNLRTPVNG